MAKSSITGWQSGVNRCWGLTVLKTAYREMYPNANAETILENAQKVEENMLAQAKSKTDYDQSVSKAVDTIRILATVDRRVERPVSEERRAGKIGRTPNSSSGLNASVVDLALKPAKEAVRTATLFDARKSLNPLAEVPTDKSVTLMADKEALNRGQTDFGKHNFFSTKVDTLNVVKLVPFILQASIQVIGKVETVERAQEITELQKSSIGFLAMEKMSRALQLAAKNGSKPGMFYTSKQQPLSSCDQKQIIVRAKNLRKEYMNAIRTIYAKLGEKFNDPQCDENMILNIGNSIKILDQLEGDTSEVPKQTVHGLDYVENVFSTAIEMYEHLLRDGNHSSGTFRGSMRANSGNDGNPSKANHSIEYFYNPIRKGQKDQNTSLKRATGRRSLGHRGDREEDGAYLYRHRRSQDNENDSSSSMTFAEVKTKYSDRMEHLIPVVEAEFAGRNDMVDVEEIMAYVKAFLNLDKGPDDAVLRSASKTVEEFYRRFCHLLPEEKDQNVAHVRKKITTKPKGSEELFHDLQRKPERVTRETVASPKKICDGQYGAKMIDPNPRKAFATPNEKYDHKDVCNHDNVLKENDETPEEIKEGSEEAAIATGLQHRNKAELLADNRKDEEAFALKEMNEEEIDDSDSDIGSDDEGKTYRETEEDGIEKELAVKKKAELETVAKVEPEDVIPEKRGAKEVKDAIATAAVLDKAAELGGPVNANMHSSRTPSRSQRTLSRTRDGSSVMTARSKSTPGRRTRSVTPGRVLRSRKTARED